MVESGGKNPTWNETVEIQIKNQNQDLTIKIMDDDLGDAKEMVCGANIKVKTLCVTGGFNEDIQLEFKGKDAGTITIKADFVPDKSPEKKVSNKIGASESGTTPVMRQSTKSKVSNEGQLTKKLTKEESNLNTVSSKVNSVAQIEGVPPENMPPADYRPEEDNGDEAEQPREENLASVGKESNKDLKSQEEK